MTAPGQMDNKIGRSVTGPVVARAATRPLLTVITVVFNAAEVLEATIRSIAAQKRPDIEYIVIDGGSKDATLDIVRRYESDIDYWMSEPDRGVYDAMNKGLAAANGAWIIFMNAGDLLWPLTEDIWALLKDDALFVYGNTRHVYTDGTTKDIIARRYDRREVLMGTHGIYHQSVIYNATYHRRFDLRYSIIADAVMTHEIARDHPDKPIHYVDRVISSYKVGGMSALRPNEIIRQKLWYLQRRWPRMDAYSYLAAVKTLYMLGSRVVRGLP